MPGFWLIVGDWGFALCAALFTALAIAASRRAGAGAGAGTQAPFVVALSFTALWALSTVLGRSIGLPATFTGGIAETMRNAAWLTVIAGLVRRTGRDDARPRGPGWLVGALALALLCQLALDTLGGEPVRVGRAVPSLVAMGWMLRAAVALGAIILLHGLFGRLQRAGVASVGWLGCALTIMWAYEFNHYVLTWASGGRVLAVGQMRGLVLALVAPLMAVGIMGGQARSFALSRRAAYRAATVAAAGLYALTLMALVMLVRIGDDPTMRLVQLSAIFALSVIALVLLPSAAFRAWLRVEIAKHLFTHRYDYRHEWMRFAEALGTHEGGEEDEGGEPLARAARAAAEAFGAPAALLLLGREDGTLAPAGDWRWTADGAAMPPQDAIGPALAARLGESGWIADLTAPDAADETLPAWLREDPRAWALAPLAHDGRLVGALLLARPPARGRIDWEDLDMLRVVGRQLAATLSERCHQEALAEAQRFDEFNRRFAFILHDIKNMVSQMSLLAANAERHADNPAFRADMVLTLKETAGRMTDLLARLARTDGARVGEEAGCGDLAAVARAVAATGPARGRAEVAGVASLPVAGDADALHQAVAHLVQNALDATPEGGAPVRLLLVRDGATARLDIVDAGCGMSAAFLDHGLFRPFASTKPSGFGLGAHEARAIVTAMGGRVDVASREGEGTRFTISLPIRAESTSEPTPAKRKSA